MTGKSKKGKQLPKKDRTSSRMAVRGLGTPDERVLFWNASPALKKNAIFAAQILGLHVECTQETAGENLDGSPQDKGHYMIAVTGETNALSRFTFVMMAKVGVLHFVVVLPVLLLAAVLGWVLWPK